MKIMPQIFGKMFADDLSSDVGMAHIQGLAWLYEQERPDCVIPFRMIREGGVLSLVADKEAAATELIEREYWAPHPTGYQVINHADVLRESLIAQANKKTRDKKAQQTKRNREKANESALESSPASALTSAPPPNNQSNNRTTNHPSGSEASNSSPDGGLSDEEVCAQFWGTSRQLASVPDSPELTN